MTPYCGIDLGQHWRNQYSYHQWCIVSFTSHQIHRKCSRFLYLVWVSKLLIWDQCCITRGLISKPLVHKQTNCSGVSLRTSIFSNIFTGGATEIVLDGKVCAENPENTKCIDVWTKWLTFRCILECIFFKMCFSSIKIHWSKLQKVIRTIKQHWSM